MEIDYEMIFMVVLLLSAESFKKVVVSYKLKYVHKVLVNCLFKVAQEKMWLGKFTPRPKVWKLRDPQTCSLFQEVFKAHVPAVETEAATTTEEIWAKLKTGLLKTTEEVCGTTKPHRWQRGTWWWNKEVDGVSVFLGPIYLDHWTLDRSK